MKTLTTLIFASLLFVPPSFAQQNGYRLQSLQPDYVFTPQGYDSNDNVQIVLYGVFTDVCHKVTQPKYRVDLGTHRIYIQHQAYVRDLCVDMYVHIPYTTIVNLGSLPSGTYDVYVPHGGSYVKTGAVPVTASSHPGVIDDYIYAQIDDVKVASNSVPGAQQLVLKGTLHNTCMSIGEIKVERSADNVYDVLPIVNIRSSNCAPAFITFERAVALPKFPAAPALVNVRSAGGQSREIVVDPRKLPFPTIE